MNYVCAVPRRRKKKCITRQIYHPFILYHYQFSWMSNRNFRWSKFWAVLTLVLRSWLQLWLVLGRDFPGPASWPIHETLVMLGFPFRAPREQSALKDRRPTSLDRPSVIIFSQAAQGVGDAMASSNGIHTDSTTIRIGSRESEVRKVVPYWLYNKYSRLVVSTAVSAAAPHLGQPGCRNTGNVYLASVHLAQPGFSL